MNFKPKKNKSLHLAHLESGYLCFFQTGSIPNPVITEATVKTGANNIVPFARGAVVTETIEQTAVKTGAKAVIGTGAKAVAGKFLNAIPVIGAFLMCLLMLKQQPKIHLAFHQQILLTLLMTLLRKA